MLQGLIDSSRYRFPLWRLPFNITEREMTAPGQESSLEEAVLLGQQEAPNPHLVHQVFSLFKGYLSSQPEEKARQLEKSAKIDKEAFTINFKGNRKQLEFNSRLSNDIIRNTQLKTHGSAVSRNGYKKYQSNPHI